MSNKIKHFLVYFIVSVFIFDVIYARTEEIFFTDITDEHLQNFESEIAYYFGAKHPEKIAKHYMKALEALEKTDGYNIVVLKKEMEPYLIKAYREVSFQTGLNFDIVKAVDYESDLILAQANRASRENIVNIMTNLYQTIFDTDSYEIRKAAMQRTFLYQYKIDILKSGNKLSKYDKIMMISLARESEALLNHVVELKRKQELRY